MSPTEPALARVGLTAINTHVFAVYSTPGNLHLGNLKRIGAVWKFKAVGYTPAGEVEPGGGALTLAHNQVFEHVELDEVNARLAPWLAV